MQNWYLNLKICHVNRYSILEIDYIHFCNNEDLRDDNFRLVYYKLQQLNVVDLSVTNYTIQTADWDILKNKSFWESW